jgi:3-dehydroquinate synthase II
VAGTAKVSLILQNAETIRLVGGKGEAISVVSLKLGDKVLGSVLEGGRHFGMAVKETIKEK